MIAPTVSRVPLQTSEAVNEQIRRQTEDRIACMAAGGSEAIERRLAELDREWDVERFLEANAASLTLLSVLLGAAANRKWFLLPAVIGGFLLQHAIQGWCPPVPIIRRLGFRTQFEIEQERYALKVLRGDFRDLPRGDEQVPATLKAVGF